MSGNSVIMEDVTIIFRNFRGEAGKFNKEGTRNFGVLLPPDKAELLAADGWNVKLLDPREDELAENPDAEPQPWLPVEAAYDKGRPPHVVQITSRGRTDLTASTVAGLDSVTMTTVDLIVNGSHYDVNGKQGIKAYLKSMYVTIEEDYLEQKYGALDSQ